MPILPINGADGTLQANKEQDSANPACLRPALLYHKRSKTDTCAHKYNMKLLLPGYAGTCPFYTMPLVSEVCMLFMRA